MKPYSPSCDDNKQVILEIITPYLEKSKTVLEIASGTGQHAVFFTQSLKHLLWQCSDLLSNLKGIQQWIDEENNKQLLNAIELDVSSHWPQNSYDAIFSANAFHIMSKSQVEDCFKNLQSVLNKSAVCLFYGPFNYHGQYTSPSNERFDAWLKNNNPKSCIKDFEWICSIAEKEGLKLINDHEMPANNRLLVFKN